MTSEKASAAETQDREADRRDPTNDRRIADAPSGNWVDARAPANVRPFLRMMRADRPIGGWLLFVPGLQGLALAGGGVDWRVQEMALSVGHRSWHGVAWLFVAFFIGSFIMRGAGCVLNDIVDRDIDAKVDRTRLRPLASGQVSMRAAALLLVGLSSLGLALLVSFNETAILVGLASALPVIVYPFMKRITWWPQVFLGVAFSWGALLASAALLGAIGAPALLLYAAAIAWTIGYDTIYAHQDREDDALIGVKSTAILFGAEGTKPALWLFYGIATLLAAAAGVAAGLGVWFWLGVAAFAAHLASQIIRLDVNDPDLCLHLFRSNRDAGLLLALGYGLGGLP